MFAEKNILTKARTESRGACVRAPECAPTRAGPRHADGLFNGLPGHGQLPVPSLPDRLAVRPKGELQFEAPASWYLSGRTVRRCRALREERT